MIKPSEPRLNAREVRELPIGSEVILHGRDRYGYSTTLKCTVVKSGKSKVLEFWAVDGLNTKPIKDYPNKYYTKA